MTGLPSRDEQIRVMEGASARARAAMDRWLDDPGVKAFLHHKDAETPVLGSKHT